MERLQGWHPDPTGRHQERYFSQGAPTHLYRDGKTEGYDDRAGFPTESSGPREAPKSQESPPAASNAPDHPPQGWYPDPLDGDRLRLWDGSQWGEQTQPRPSVSQETESGSTPPVPALARPANGAPGPAARCCTHCGAPLAEGSGRWVGDSHPTDPVSPPIHASYVSQADPQQNPPQPTVGRDHAMVAHNGTGSIGYGIPQHSREPGRRWGDDTARVPTNGAKGAAVKSLPDPVPRQSPTVASDLVPSPGWYPVQGSPEFVRWWDGTEWGAVREAGPAPAGSPSST